MMNSKLISAAFLFIVLPAFAATVALADEQETIRAEAKSLELDFVPKDLNYSSLGEYLYATGIAKLSVIGVEKMQVIKSIPLSEYTCGILDTGDRVIAAHPKSCSITVIDKKTWNISTVKKLINVSRRSGDYAFKLLEPVEEKPEYFYIMVYGGVRSHVMKVNAKSLMVVGRLYSKVISKDTVISISDKYLYLSRGEIPHAYDLSKTEHFRNDAAEPRNVEPDFAVPSGTRIYSAFGGGRFVAAGGFIRSGNLSVKYSVIPRGLARGYHRTRPLYFNLLQPDSKDGTAKRLEVLSPFNITPLTTYLDIKIPHKSSHSRFVIAALDKHNLLLVKGSESRTLYFIKMDFAALEKKSGPQFLNTPEHMAYCGRKYSYNPEFKGMSGKMKVLGTKLPEGMKLDAQTGAVTWTPGGEQKGTYNLTYTVIDEKGNTLTQEWTLEVRALELPAFLPSEHIPLDYRERRPPPLSHYTPTADGKYIVMFAKDARMLVVFDARQLELVKAVKVDMEIRGLCSIGSKMFIADNRGKKVLVFDTASMKLRTLAQIDQRPTQIHSVESDGKKFLLLHTYPPSSGGKDNELHLMDPETGKIEKTLELPGGGERSVCVTGDGKKVAVVLDKGMSFIDLEGFKLGPPLVETGGERIIGLDPRTGLPVYAYGPAPEGVPYALVRRSIALRGLYGVRDEYRQVHPTLPIVVISKLTTRKDPHNSRTISSRRTVLAPLAPGQKPFKIFGDISVSIDAVNDSLIEKRDGSSTILFADFERLLDGRVVFTSTPSPVAFVGTEYAYQPVLYNVKKEVKYKLAQAPSGMTIDEKTGRITWKPKRENVHTQANVVIEVTDGERTDMQTFTIAVMWKAIPAPGTAEKFKTYEPKGIAVFIERGLSTTQEPTVRINSLADGSRIARLTFSENISDATVCGDWLLVALSTGGTILLYDANTFKQVNRISLPGTGIKKIVYNNQAGTAYAITIEGKMHRLDMANAVDAGAVLEVSDAKFTADGRYLYAVVNKPDSDLATVLTNGGQYKDKCLVKYAVRGNEFAPVDVMEMRNYRDFSVTPGGYVVLASKTQVSNRDFWVVEIRDRGDLLSASGGLRLVHREAGMVVADRSSESALCMDMDGLIYRIYPGRTAETSVEQYVDMTPGPETHHTSTQIKPTEIGTSEDGKTFYIFSRNDGLLYLYDIDAAKPLPRPVEFLETPGLKASWGEKYSTHFKAKGKDVKYFLRCAPKGMSIDEKTGAVEWQVPDVMEGLVRVTAAAKDAAGNEASLTWIIRVAEAELPLGFTSFPQKMTIEPEKAFNYQVKAAGKDLVFILAKSPEGATISKEGMLSWTPYIEGDYQFTIIVRDAKGNQVFQAFTLRVRKPD